MLATIFEAGAVLIVVAGIVGGFIAGFRTQKSSTTNDANETIALINEAKKALEEKISAQAAIISAQGETIAKQD